MIVDPLRSSLMCQHERDRRRGAARVRHASTERACAAYWPAGAGYTAVRTSLGEIFQLFLSGPFNTCLRQVATRFFFKTLIQHTQLAPLTLTLTLVQFTTILETIPRLLTTTPATVHALIVRHTSSINRGLALTLGSAMLFQLI